jgi:nitrogen PTS system EIIA component
MPHRILNLDEAADYLHLPRADVDQLVKNAEIPFEKRGDRVVFVLQNLEAWASQRILGLSSRRLAEYHQKSTNRTREVFEQEAILSAMISPTDIDSAMKAKTKASVVRSMVALADKTGKVMDPRELLASIEEREALCSTALPGGLALLHARHHLPYLFESTFMVLGRTIQEIPYGAPDGQPTRLFFLICCQDDRIHLHTLARLCLMAQKTDLLTDLGQASDADSMHACLIATEQEVLPGKRGAAL